MYRIPLHVEGIDLEDDDTLSTIGAGLADLSWAEIDGRVLATVHTDSRAPQGQDAQGQNTQGQDSGSQDVVATVLAAAHRIERSLGGARVREVDQELVNVSDIAHRIGVSREAVRLWSEGRRGAGGFPSAVGAPGSSKVWRWFRVSEWLTRHYGLTDDVRYLSDEQLAQINYSLVSGVEQATKD